jgi:predicted esterase
MRRSLLVALAFSGAVLAQDADGLRLRLEAYLHAENDDQKKSALDSLESVAVPRDPIGRVQAIRRALPVPTRKSSSRIKETLGEVECFFVTPKSYSPKKPVPVVVSIHGRGGSGHDGLQPFALPDEEWQEVLKKYADKLTPQVPGGKLSSIQKPAPKVPWEDGLVIAPSEPDSHLEHEVAEEAVLAALERMNRSYAGDPDRVTLAGISMGGAAACFIAERHPDRFAGLVAVAGYDPRHVENLSGLPIYMIHGTKDDHTPLDAARTMDACLKEKKIPHVYREIEGMGHRWPDADEGAKLKAWMREGVRQPWPRAFSFDFLESKKARRCFWIEMPPGRDAHVSAKVTENTIEVAATNVPGLVLHLGEPLVDLDKEISVLWRADSSGGADAPPAKEVFRGKLARSWSDLLADLDATGFDLPRAAPARLEIKAP